MGSPRPGKFPATIVAVQGKVVVLEAATAEDIEYLIPFVRTSVSVDITPDHSPAGDPGSDSGSDSETGSVPPAALSGS